MGKEFRNSMFKRHPDFSWAQVQNLTRFLKYQLLLRQCILVYSHYSYGSMEEKNLHYLFT